MKSRPYRPGMVKDAILHEADLAAPRSTWLWRSVHRKLNNAVFRQTLIMIRQLGRQIREEALLEEEKRQATARSPHRRRSHARVYRRRPRRAVPGQMSLPGIL